MYVEHHPLIKEFPEYREKIHELKTSDPEFKKLFDEYHEIDKEICRIEEDIELARDEYAEILKKKRVFLKDALYRMLQKGSG